MKADMNVGKYLVLLCLLANGDPARLLEAQGFRSRKPDGLWTEDPGYAP